MYFTMIACYTITSCTMIACYTITSYCVLYHYVMYNDCVLYHYVILRAIPLRHIACYTITSCLLSLYCCFYIYTRVTIFGIHWYVMIYKLVLSFSRNPIWRLCLSKNFINARYGNIIYCRETSVLKVGLLRYRRFFPY